MGPQHRRGVKISKPIDVHNFLSIQPIPSILTSEDRQLIKEDMSIKRNIGHVPCNVMIAFNIKKKTVVTA